jgi:hypothetical protein
VINSNGSERSWRGGRRIVVLASTVASAAVLGTMLFGAGTASAAGYNCGGTVQPKEKGNPGIDGKFAVQCTADIRGFSIITNKKFDFFGSELIVFEGGKESSQSSLFQCEGVVPGSGFGCGTVNRNTPSGCGAPNAVQCANKITAGNVTIGQLGFPKSPCKYKPTDDRLKIWMIAVNEPVITPQGAAATTGLYPSEPFRLKVKGWSAGACAAATEANKTK